LKPNTQPDIRELNPKVSEWMSGFVRKAMAIRPENRYQSVADMRRELQTQVFKVRRPAARPAQPFKLVGAPQTGSPVVERQYRHRASAPAKRTSKACPERSRRGEPAHPVGRWLPALLPIAVPVGVVLILAGVVTFISMVTSSVAAAAVIVVPLILFGLAYYALVSGRRSGPPRI
jgi:hypothetical protein